MMGIYINLRNIRVDSCLFSVFQASHMIVILEYVIEGSVFINKDVYCLIAHELRLLA